MLARRALSTLALVASGCSATLLLHRDDRTFARSLARFQRGQAVAAATGAPSEELAMFLLGDALDRYRFSMGARSASSYGAQAAAAALDLPALQSVAGSFDLFHLRLRARDGAVQVWESLLDRYPQSRLEPLVLYRLGWAYRSVVTPGFPRDSAAAFDLVAHRYPDSPLAPLAREASATPWRSQGSATAWSLVPGLGQMYAGEYANGTVRLSISLAGAAMVLVPAIVAYQRRDSLSWRDDWPLLATGLGGLVVLSVDYSDSYEDALRAVMEFNERQEDAFEASHPDAP